MNYRQAQFYCEGRAEGCRRTFVVNLGPAPLGDPEHVAAMCPDKCGACGSPMVRKVGKGTVHFGLDFSVQR